MKPARIRLSWRALLGALAITAAATLPAAAASSDYTQSVTQLNATQARISFTPTTPALYVDVHYIGAPGLGQHIRPRRISGGLISKYESTA